MTDKTQDVDFIINIASAPESVKTKLLSLPNSPFVQHAQYFYYKSRDGSYVQIDITPEWQVSTQSLSLEIQPLSPTGESLK